MWNQIKQRIAEEPVALIELIKIALMLGIAFGLTITTEQFGLLIALISGVLMFFVRDRTTAVTPTTLTSYVVTKTGQPLEKDHHAEDPDA